MPPQRHEDGTRFPDKPSSEPYGIDFGHLHRREGEIAPPTQEWIRDFKLAQATAKSSQEHMVHEVLPEGVIASREIGGTGSKIEKVLRFPELQQEQELEDAA